MGRYSIGLDFGSLSARGVLMDTQNGEILSSAVFDYPHGIMDTALPGGTPLKSDWAVQHPQDYWDAFHAIVPELLSRAGVRGEEICGIGLDVTSCTILPTAANGTPLCCLAGYDTRPHAYVKMWKHHGGAPYVDAIRDLALKRDEPWLGQFGGSISAEHYLPKIMELVTEDAALYAAADRIIEMGDWLVWRLCGREVRGYTAAAFKTFYSPQRGDLSPDFLAALHPLLKDLNEKHPAPVLYGGDRAGKLCAQAAAWLGLPAGIPVSAPGVDAHVTLNGCGICDPGDLLLVIGTSTCAIMVSDVYREVAGLSGVVPEGILPALHAYEGGQSTVGDLFAWFTEHYTCAALEQEAAQRGLSLHALLTEKAACLAPGESGLVALDWWNGVRSTLMDFDLSGLMVGMTLHTAPEEIYRALLESTAYGLRGIIDAMEKEGVPIRRIYAAGGIPMKNPLLLQIYADVCGREVHLVERAHTGAVGSAILGAAAGEQEQGFALLRELGGKYRPEKSSCYHPCAENTPIYDKLYAIYCELSNHFGKESSLMKDLKAIRLQAGK